MWATKEKPSVDMLMEGLTNAPREVIGPYVSVPVFLRKPIATFNFQGVGVPDPLSPLWIRH